MIVLGLTGSIGMGKSTTAAIFEDLGVPVHDSDRTVHDLYAGEAVEPISQAFPGTIVDGVVDRQKLAALVLGDRDALKRLEGIVHPMVRQRADAFLEHHRAAGTPVVVLDIPLLYETGGETRVDRVVVVSAPADIQRARVLARPGMTEEKFESILAKQVPDAEKRRRAHHVIDSGSGIEAARDQVTALVAELRGET